MKRDFSTIGSLLAPALRQYNFDESIIQGQVVEAYKAIVGPMLTRLTYQMHYDPVHRTLHLRLASPALRHEYSYKLTDLRDAINARLPQPAVEKITLG